MNPSLKYTPVFVGLYISLVLAVTCNAFLDIQYGVFGTEVLIWAIVYSVTLWVGWKQHGQITKTGRTWHKWLMAIAVIVSVVVFLPMWGLPRAGIYILAAFQASYNCVTTTRRHLYVGLLVATTMVIFSASHFRADWTILFYLIPFTIAVVFTLVADQISHRIDDLHDQSLGKQVIGGQGLAIGAASFIILALTAVLYAITPQVTWRTFSWPYGVSGGTGSSSQSVKIDNGTDQAPRSGNSGYSGDKSGQAGQGEEVSGGTWGVGVGHGSTTEERGAKSGLTPAEMRRSAQKRGMPRWQSALINTMADIAETAEKRLVSIRKSGKDLYNALKQWLQAHKESLFYTIVVLMLLALLVALWRLLREARIGIWIMTRADYLRYAVLGRYAPGSVGAIQLYQATERLFALQDQPRQPTFSAREYFSQIHGLHPDLRIELGELRRIFEAARYGPTPPDKRQLQRMRMIYRNLFDGSF